jgi:hypothetical protein
MARTGLAVQFKKVDITPDYPVKLAGYFNERLSEGVLDPLSLRLAALESGGRHLVFIQIDNCAIPVEDAAEIRREIARRSRFKKREIMLLTSHIHTGPDLIGFFGLARDERYLRDLKKKVIDEASRLEPRQPSSISIARTIYEGLSYNRRWFMQDGTVETNPPKKSPDRREPEGAVDREANAVVFKDERGDPQAVFVNISNHADTIGGSRISADWPGFMERHLNSLLGCNIPVFPFLAPQGNINHFDFEDGRPQSSYEEAGRLGRAYAEVIARSLSELRPMEAGRLAGRALRLEAEEILLPIPSRIVPQDELRRAKDILSRESRRVQDRERALTAEDLTKGDPAVEQLFARELIRHVQSQPRRLRVPLQTFKLGSVAFAAIPGEPFVEVGLALKRIKGYELIFPVALANGYIGYIPLRENFGRGGYETRTSSVSCLSPDAADRILAAFRSLLAKKDIV